MKTIILSLALLCCSAVYAEIVPGDLVILDCQGNPTAFSATYNGVQRGAPDRYEVILENGKSYIFSLNQCNIQEF